MSAALWLKHLGIAPRIIEAGPSLGGQLRRNWHANPWVLGFPGSTGTALAECFTSHVVSESIAVSTDTAIMDLQRLPSGGFRLTLNGDTLMETRALLWCTGSRIRTDETLRALPGYEQAKASGHIHFGAPEHEWIRARKGERVVVMGGGDNAFEHALFLADAGAEVTLLMRSPPHAQAAFQHRVAKRPEIALLTPQSLLGFDRAGKGLLLRLKDAALPCHHLLCMFGYAPNTELPVRCLPGLRVDGKHHLLASSECRTDIPGFYAAGDVVSGTLPSIPTALAAGAVAAKTIEQDLRNA